MISRRVRMWACAVGLLVTASTRPGAQTPTDADADGLPDAWESQFGLNPASDVGDDGATGDPDHDGLTNAAELAAGSHPRGTWTRLFAEGATGTFFDTRFALFNADLFQSARTLLRFQRADGVTLSQVVTLLPGARVTIDPEQIAGLESAAFSTIVEADTWVVADRTMLWDSRHYGSHAETGIPRPSTTWYLAEGATHLTFNLFYLLQNPNAATASVRVTYLLASGPPLVKTYAVGANSRANIWVDEEDPLLASTDVSAVIQSDLPIVVERSMYSNAGGLPFGAGHASAGVAAPALDWFLAEGATGDFFDLFVLIANPNAEAATLAVTYLLPDGRTVARNYSVGPRSRLTIYVDNESQRLRNTAVSTVVHSTKGVPVIVERAMWWPGPAYGEHYWSEGHSSAGATSTSPRWALADGEQDGADRAETYVLIANTSTFAGSARVTLYFEDGGAATTLVALPAQSRNTVRIASTFPEAAGRRFGTLIESQGATPPQLVVERAMYSSVGTDVWAAGTNALATPLPSAPAGDGSAISITATDAQAFEQGADGAVLAFTRSVAGSASTVQYSVGGSATPGSDYRALTGRVTFPAGALSVTVPILVFDDSEAEPTETITATLVPDSTYGITAPALTTVQLQDNDTVAVPESTIDAARFLAQATFGPTFADIQQVQTQGYQAWLTAQMALPPSSFLARLDSIPADDLSEDDLEETWFTYAVTGRDQLRQRVANALLEIMVVSSANGLEGEAEAMGAYMDILQRNAFGNFRTLLQDVTLSPAMGQYLSHLKNDKPGPDHNPDENYAREVLQLFTIGLNKLNVDGTPIRDGQGALVATYDQSVVEAFAHVFTGWTFNHAGSPNFYDPPEDWRNPMRGIESHHSTRSKRILDGVTLPAGLLMTEDLQRALDTIFNHPNVGPFVGRQLIQRLVTSNPSAPYIARVAAAFNNNGSNVRGDLAAVVRAILLDPEARGLETARGPYFGHLREPMIRFVAVLRAFAAGADSGRYRVTRLEDTLGQAPFRSPSVFNFFAPDYRKAGTIASLGLYSPEFQIATEQWVIAYSNTMRRLALDGYGYDEDTLRLNLQSETALAATPGALVERLNVLLFAGQMSSELRNIIVEALESVPPAEPEARARLAVSLALMSPEFVVQK